MLKRIIECVKRNVITYINNFIAYRLIQYTFFFRVVPMQDLKGAVSLCITELKEGEILEVGYEMVTKALENSTLRIKFMVTIFNYE
mgnify:CR=1 FL=1